MALFEHIIMLRQDLSSSDLEDALRTHEQTLSEFKGNVLYKESWGLRSLAYRIKKNRKGHYVMLNMETGPEALREYERIMGLNEDILRFLNLNIKEIEDGPSIMLQAKTERSSRGQRDYSDANEQDDKSVSPENSED